MNQDPGIEPLRNETFGLVVVGSGAAAQQPSLEDGCDRREILWRYAPGSSRYRSTTHLFVHAYLPIDKQALQAAVRAKVNETFLNINEGIQGIDKAVTLYTLNVKLRKPAMVDIIL